MKNTQFAPVLIFLIFCNAPYAGTVVEEFSKITIPNSESTAFERWIYDIALFTSQNCWLKDHNKENIPTELKKNLYSDGTYSLPTNSQRDIICASIEKNGIHPVCTYSAISSNKNLSGFSSDYLYVTDKNFQLKGGVYCYLNKDQIQKQFFVESPTYQWITEPTVQTINTSQGEKQVNMGNILVIFPSAKNMQGQPYTEPKIVIIK